MGPELGARTQSRPSTWIAGTQLSEPSSPPPRICFSRRLDQEKKPGIEPKHSSMSMCDVGISIARWNAHPRAVLLSSTSLFRKELSAIYWLYNLSFLNLCLSVLICSNGHNNTLSDFFFSPRSELDSENHRHSTVKQLCACWLLLLSTKHDRSKKSRQPWLQIHLYGGKIYTMKVIKVHSMFSR